MITARRAAVARLAEVIRPPAAPPATPVEAFAAAPDAHFVSHDSVEPMFPELLDSASRAPETNRDGTVGVRRSCPDVASVAGLQVHLGGKSSTSSQETRDLMPDTVASPWASSHGFRRRAQRSRGPGLQGHSRTRPASTALRSRHSPDSGDLEPPTGTTPSASAIRARRDRSRTRSSCFRRAAIR